MKKFLAFIFILIMIFSELAILEFIPSANAQGSLTGWNYRKSHVINSATGAGTNYQVQITCYYGSGTDSGGSVYLNSHSRTDFGDVRFTKSDGTTLLDYWMMSYTASNNAIFWVKIADDLSSANVTIYIYYGNSTATTTSNFDNTFIFGDPFDNTTLNTARWTSVDGGPTYTINATGHYIEVTDMSSPTWWGGVGFHSKTGISFPDTYIVEDAYSSSGQKISHYSESNIQIFGAGFEIKNTTAVVSGSSIQDAWSSSSNYVKSANVGASSWSSGTLTGSAGVWYNLLTRIWKLGGNITAEIDGTQVLNVTNSDTSDRVLLEIARYQAYGFGTERFFAFKIRKYVSPEPAHGSWGNEETPNAAQELNYSFVETVAPVSTLRSGGEAVSILIETIYPTESIIYWQEQWHIFTETINPSATPYYWTEIVGLPPSIIKWGFVFALAIALSLVFSLVFEKEKKGEE